MMLPPPPPPPPQQQQQQISYFETSSSLSNPLVSREQQYAIDENNINNDNNNNNAENENSYNWGDISPLRFIYVALNGHITSMPTTTVINNYNHNSTYNSFHFNRSSKQQQNKQQIKNNNNKKNVIPHLDDNIPIQTDSARHERDGKNGNVLQQQHHNGNKNDNNNNNSVWRKNEYFVPDGVFEEYVLTYLDVTDLCSVCMVSHRWYEAGRSDKLWKRACIHLWKDKVGLPKAVPQQSDDTKRKSNKDIALFWRSWWDYESVIMNQPFTIREFVSYFAERPSSKQKLKDTFLHILEKQDFRQAILLNLPEPPSFLESQSLQSSEEKEDSLLIDNNENDYLSDNKNLYFNTTPFCHSNNIKTTASRAIGTNKKSPKFHQKWFGSYASSIIDSKRTTLTLDELCNRNGFDMHFKVYSNDPDITASHTNDNDDDSRNYDDTNHEILWKLHYHSTCYFDENFQFRVEGENNPHDHNNNINHHRFHADETNNLNNNNDHNNTTAQQPSWQEHQENNPYLCHWKWVVLGKVIRVGSYPPLIVSRIENNWGWKLENRNVLFFYRGNP